MAAETPEIALNSLQKAAITRAPANLPAMPPHQRSQKDAQGRHWTLAPLLAVAVAGAVVVALVTSTFCKARLSTCLPGREPLLRCFLHFLVVAFLCTCTLSAAGDIEPRNRHISLPGAPPSADDQNPYAYIFGSVLDRTLVRSEKGQYGTNISFRPRYASEIYIESVLFCGNQTGMFSVNGPIVITFERLAHEMIRDVPCYKLVGVDHIESKAAASQ